MNNQECKICNRSFSSLKSLSLHLWQTHDVKSKDYYNKYLKKDTDGHCIMCGKETKCNGLRGYFPTCSTQCGNMNPDAINKIKQTFIDRNVINKRRQNTFLKYGVYSINQTPQGRLLCKNNALEQVKRQCIHGDPMTPRIGNQERECLNILEQVGGCVIERNKCFLVEYHRVRYPDGCIPKLNIFIQFDERVHFHDGECKMYKDDDIKCTLQLASLGYLVFRISEKRWKENKDNVILDFKQLIKAVECDRI